MSRKALRYEGWYPCTELRLIELKFSVFVVEGNSLALELRGQLEGLFTAPRFVARDPNGKAIAEKLHRLNSMQSINSQLPLTNSKALVVGIANQHSIAYGCAKAFRELGADLSIAFLNEKAGPHVEPLARALAADLFLPLDFAQRGQLEAVFARIAQEWSRLDIPVHSVAFAPKDDLQGSLLDCSADGFAKAMDISCHSFIRLVKLAAPLMKEVRNDVRDDLLRRKTKSFPITM